MKLQQLRGELLRHGVEEGLTNNEVMLLWHILDFDFNNKGVSWPSRTSLAKRMGFKNETSISNMLAQLEKKKFIKRILRTGISNQYDWKWLIERFQKYIGSSSTNEGGLHPRMKGSSSTNEGGLHPRMNQSSSMEALQRNSSNETLEKNMLHQKSEAKACPENPSKTSEIYSEFFETFWQAYPKRNGRKATKGQTKDFIVKSKKIKIADFEPLLIAVNNYACECNGYAKDPIRFLKNDFWRDYITPKESEHEAQKKNWEKLLREADEYEKNTPRLFRQVKD